MEEARLKELQEREDKVVELRHAERIAKEDIARAKGGRSKIGAAVRGVRVVLRR